MLCRIWTGYISSSIEMILLPACYAPGVFFLAFWSCGRAVLSLLVINLAEKKKKIQRPKLYRSLTEANTPLIGKIIIQMQTNLKGPIKLDRTSSSLRILRDRTWSSGTIK